MIYIGVFIIISILCYLIFFKSNFKKVITTVQQPKKRNVKLNVQTELTKAISVRQPYAEQIMMGVKTQEYRAIPTNIRGRIYIYASNTLEKNDEEIKKTGKNADELIRGVLIGTVEITDCLKLNERDFAWQLQNPFRLEQPIKPTNKPQPVWFNPF